MHALGMICKSCHDFLDTVSNIMHLFVIVLSVFLCHVRPRAARSKTTRYDRIMSEMFSLIVDFCLYIFAAML